MARPTLMYVEDSPGEAHLFDLALRAADSAFDLVVVPGGEEALDMLANQEVLPDMLLIDLSLLGMSGHELLERLKADARFKHIPTAVLSHSANTADVRRAWDANTVAYTQKPESLRDYRKAVAAFSSFWAEHVRFPSSLQ